MTSEFIKTLKEIISKKQIAHIYRKFGTSPILCIPLAIGEEVLLIQCLHDFHLDGYGIVRLKDISEIVSGELEHFLESIFNKEGIHETVKKPDINIGNTIFDVLNEINKIGMNFIIECEDLSENTMYVGKISSLGDRLLFKTFGVLGDWDDDLLEVEYDDITWIRFNDEYSRVYSKYLQAE